MAAVDAIVAQDELAMVAWDCSVWGGSPKCGYPADVRARAIERLTDFNWLISLALFKIDSVDLEVKHERFYYYIPKISTQDSDMLDKVLPKLMTENGFAGFMHKNLKDKIKDQFANIYYLKELGYYGRLAGTEPGSPEFADIFGGLQESLLKGWISFCYKQGRDELAAGCIARYLNDIACGEVYGDNVWDLVFAMKLRFEPTADSLNMLRRQMGSNLVSPKKEIVEFFVEIGGKIKTADQGRLFYDLCKGMKDKKEIDSILTRVGELVVTDNVALLKQGDLRKFKLAYQQCPIFSNDYISSELISRLKKENKMLQFIECFDETLDAETKFGLSVRLGCLDYLKKNLGNFDLGTKLKTPELTLLEIALQSGETGIADYLWEQGASAPNLDNISFSKDNVVVALEWMMKQNLKVGNEKITPELCFVNVLCNGNIEVAEALRTHYKFKITTPFDAIVINCVRNMKTPKDLREVNKRLDLIMQYGGSLNKYGELSDKKDKLKKEFRTAMCLQIMKVVDYLRQTAKYPLDEKSQNYSALAKLVENLSLYDDVQYGMMLHAILALVRNGADVNAVINTTKMRDVSMRLVDELLDVYERSPDAFWYGNFKQQRKWSDVSVSSAAQTEIRKIEKKYGDLDAKEEEGKYRERIAFTDADKMVAWGFQAGVASLKEKRQAELKDVFTQILKENNKIQYEGIFTPVLYALIEKEIDWLVEEMLQKGAKIPCQKIEQYGDNRTVYDALDLVEKKEDSKVAKLLRQAYRKNNVQPISKPTAVQEAGNTAKAAREEGKAATQCKANRMKLKLRLKYGDDDAGLKCPSGGQYTVKSDKSVVCDKHP